eukprot:6429679-Lingulodinium_polyedra.AAC.1
MAATRIHIRTYVIHTYGKCQALAWMSTPGRNAVQTPRTEQTARQTTDGTDRKQAWPRTELALYRL